MAREYRDSGIEWIGQIPKEWEIGKVKNYYSLQTGFTPDTKNELYYDDNGALWVNISDMGDSHYISNTKKKISDYYISKFKPPIVPKGSLLYSFKLSVGTVAIAGEEMYTNEAIAAFLQKDGINLSFLYYSSQVCIIFNANENIYGAKLLNQDLINNATIIFPPLAEQQKIANYLDEVCGEVEEMIALQEQMIEELKAYKQSVITEAVTKGLNPNVPMRDSGIDWIGEIPEHWKVTVLRRFATIILGKMLQPNAKSDDDTLEQYICAKDVHFEGIDFSDLKKMYFDKDEKETYQVQKGDMLVVEGGAGAAGSCVLKTDLPDTYIQNSIMIVRPKQGIDIRYIQYFEFSLVKKGYVDFVCNKATIPHFTKDKLSSMPIPLPPLSEQQSIASYLDTKCAEIDALIAIKQAKIDELKDYKKSVIYEYVTGKKEVA